RKSERRFPAIVSFACLNRHQTHTYNWKQKASAGEFMAITITTEFQDALDQINAGQNVLITGKAGTGKSTLLRTFLDGVKHKKVLVTAPTGVAALNVGGFTIQK